MSLRTDFEPHSHYMGFAILDNREHKIKDESSDLPSQYRWHAYIGNGNTYRVDGVKAYGKHELKRLIREYHVQQGNGYGERIKEKEGKK
jgi:hypothetical protein